MNAVILAAGKGERLKEVTQNIPKPMIEFKGKPILVHNIELCKAWGVRHIFINTFHLGDIIREYCGDGSRWGVSIEYSIEEELLGTAGALNSFKGKLSAEPFFVVYGDNYSEFDLSALKCKSKETGSIAVIGFHWREDTSSSGVAEFDTDQKILRFIEKPKPGESDSHWVNAGVYYLQPAVLDLIPSGNSDFAKDIFPSLLGNNIPIYGVCQNIDVHAFDTPEMYKNSFQRS
jgi:NDP-sugar pyrophosphorylase family protein